MSDIEEAQDLRSRISRLPDDELLQMVVTGRAQYRPDAIEFAQSELKRRGLELDAKESGTADHPDAGDSEASEPAGPEVRYEVFRGTFATWDSLFAEAAAFASQIGRDRLISMSHSADSSDGVVTVWYWSR